MDKKCYFLPGTFTPAQTNALKSRSLVFLEKFTDITTNEDGIVLWGELESACQAMCLLPGEQRSSGLAGVTRVSTTPAILPHVTVAGEPGASQPPTTMAQLSVLTNQLKALQAWSNLPEAQRAARVELTQRCSASNEGLRVALTQCQGLECEVSQVGSLAQQIGRYDLPEALSVELTAFVAARRAAFDQARQRVEEARVQLERDRQALSQELEKPVVCAEDVLLSSLRTLKLSGAAQ